MISASQLTARSPLADWLQWQESHHPSAIDLGLDRVRHVAEKLGVLSPRARIITVAGTNGKGSCIATLEAFLAAADLKFAAYTSPHLLNYNERIRLQATPVDDALLCDAFDRINRARADISLTYFEFGTLAAMVIFNDYSLDYWLLEVGLGGRLDAVNIIDPSVAVITSIALDHEAWLGNTREAIGYEKAGICRSNTPLICTESNPPSTVLARAETLGCPAKWWLHDFHGSKHGSLSTLQLSNGQQLVVDHLMLPIPSVVAALEVCLHECLLPEPAQCVKLLTGLGLAGRMQSVVLDIPANIYKSIESKLVDKRLGKTQACNQLPAILDVAHNPAATSLLAESLASLPETPCVAIISMMTDKDITAALKPLSSIINRWLCVDLADNPRAATAEAIKAVLVDDMGVDDLAINTYPSFTTALKECASIRDDIKRGNAKDPVLIFGSFFIVAEALSCLRTT